MKTIIAVICRPSPQVAVPAPPGQVGELVMWVGFKSWTSSAFPLTVRTGELAVAH
jgi:hypothetical protein